MSSIVSFLGNAVLLAIAAIVATVVAVLIIGRIDETFVSILTSNVLSLFTAILSIVVLEVYDSIAKKILTACIYSAVLMIAMLILMILKRIFALFIDNDKTI